jgi:hypothetical protein
VCCRIPSKKKAASNQGQSMHTVTIEVECYTDHVDLVTYQKTVEKEGDVMAEKKHQVPQVPAPGGGKQDRSRDNDGEWRKKRDDAGKVRPKK